jgi:hypothetical protein
MLSSPYTINAKKTIYPSRRRLDNRAAREVRLDKQRPALNMTPQMGSDR